ncbi:MAG: hypothetical protein H6836_05070 [Planctomycetes bacterium]|nr:hypothetical protein [Planctomycetota bacterium]
MLLSIRAACAATALLLGAAPQQPCASPPEPWGPEAIDAYVTAARARALAACKARKLALPADFLAWIDADPLLRRSVFGCRKDPLPVLLALRSLEIDLGAETVRRRYPQLALAFAIQASYRAPRRAASRWNDGDDSPAGAALPDVAARPPLSLAVPGDPRVRVDTKAKDRSLDRDDHVINFLEDHAPITVEVVRREPAPLEYDAKGRAKKRRKTVEVKHQVVRPLVGADVIADAALQREFNSYLAAHGHPEVRLDCGDRVVHWRSRVAVRDRELRRRIAAAHQLFLDAYRAKGRMPKARDRAPSMAESMAWLVRNDRYTFPAGQQTARAWPRFPLNAPWPLLMMLAADDQPLREREAIWEAFRERGEFRTYGEYIGGIAQQFDMQSARRVSPFAFDYGSIQMMWKDGGVCGTMGNIGARTWRIVGVPASTAGQPGHCALVRMERDARTGAFRCRGEQYATGGDEVTTVHAGWNYDDVGGRRGMVFHQSIAWGVNHGLAAFVDTLVLRRMWDARAAHSRAESVEFVRAALARNPFALAALLGAIGSADSAATALAIGDAFVAVLDAHPRRGELSLYRSTVLGLVHRKVSALPAPRGRAAALELLATLERQQCGLAGLLARTWRQIGGEAEFRARTLAALRGYLAAPERSMNRRTADAFAGRLHGFARTIRGEPARRSWATTLLDACRGHETLKLRRKAVVDPVVAALCKMLGREPPAVRK